MMEVDAASSQANNIRMMEVNNHSSISIEKQPLEVPTSRNEAENNSVNDESSTPVFINHGAIAWNEDRRRWLGDQSQKLERMPKYPDTPIISWSTTYEDLLSTNNRFSEPIPLSEMVDFLVDIWHTEGSDGIDMLSEKPIMYSISLMQPSRAEDP
ncbi:peptidase S10, serine carboxypeptidase, alpha/beta hydrolase fold protein [Tanacetum coccineum]